MKVLIYCGDSAESWTPDNEATGIGGSEEAVINVSRELVKLGDEVVVYNRCGKGKGVYDGVTYKDFETYDGESCDVFVGWRSINPWTIGKNYKVGYHWLHDTTPENEVINALKLGASKVMVLSKYHRRLYPHIPNNRIFLTRNGVNVGQFDQDVKRVKGRLFYGSSYDRGLRELLEEWPQIKLRNPDATLHIAYGWQGLESALGANSTTFMNVKSYFEELFNQEGITHLGRISHREVAKEMLEAQVWAYPCWWPEISCITAMKAQVGGAYPVVIPTAAVAETVIHGAKTDRGYFIDLHGQTVKPAGTVEQFIDSVNTALSLPIPSDGTQGWAETSFSWENVAEQWQREFADAVQH